MPFKNYSKPDCDDLLRSQFGGMPRNWTPVDRTAAAKQGWMIFKQTICSYYGALTNDVIIFWTHSDAMAFVKERAEAGDALCEKALISLMKARFDD